MNEAMKTESCERGNDLISFLYGDVDEHESRDFEGHLKFCRQCQSELASFGSVRQSIGVWKEEALSGFVSPRIVTPVREKSALAALREFFDLSPLWLKGAVGFAAMLLCVIALALVMAEMKVQPAQQVVKQSNLKYTEEQHRALVDQALKEQQQHLASAAITTPEKEIETPKPTSIKVRDSRPVNRSTQWGRSLSKSERAQLAADLRLRSTTDEDNLSLIGERINQDFQR